ncbi:uncharacterized protein MELLADRAFT_110823 [Melampsora larici-populina 98AG31]|uniref:Secreted protein n=1 Tax=Melampsora larici-populina (strain 98AG31 / pathotype 3-4-7) TaxID=747676 RepID=F4S134_MELLP|nr:uncharacterized protein MELLADRAFT_110823 [Melampsora larici-populina 98AG31]EGG01699.1 hypothetical protein MELLADRAFT_110823 [Melampsora larici-populina 98AG31]
MLQILKSFILFTTFILFTSSVSADKCVVCRYNSQKYDPTNVDTTTKVFCTGAVANPMGCTYAGYNTHNKDPKAPSRNEIWCKAKCKEDARGNVPNCPPVMTDYGYKGEQLKHPVSELISQGSSRDCRGCQRDTEPYLPETDAGTENHLGFLSTSKVEGIDQIPNKFRSPFPDADTGKRN